MKTLSALAYTLVCLAASAVLWFYASWSAAKTVVSYYPDGTVHQIRNLDADGMKHGETRIYFPAGKLMSLIEFEHNQMVRAKHYHEDGTLVSELTEGPNYEGRTETYINK